MEQLTDSKNHPCWAESSCIHKIGDTCGFWKHVEALLSVLQEKHHKGSNCIVNCIDMFREPCLDLNEEERQRGVTDILGIYNPTG